MLTAITNSSRQNQKLTAKPKTHGKTKKLTAKKERKERKRKGSWALIVQAKAVGVKSNMAASAAST